MGATETAVRDPVFFRWHHFVDQQLDRARKVLPPYLPTKVYLKLQSLSTSLSFNYVFCFLKKWWKNHSFL